MKTACLLALLPISILHSATQDQASAALHSFVEAHCVECHDSETKKGGLDLTALKLDAASFDAWVQVHDRVQAGEMPPEKKPRPAAKELDAAMTSLSQQLVAMDTAREQREGRTGLRRLSRVEFENTLRDVLALPALRVAHELPADGKAHGFDRSPAALDFSFVHLAKHVAAVDAALNAATPAFVEKPPVF